MASITTRAGKSSPLTHNEVDANFNNLNSDKLDTAGIALGSAASPTIKFTGDTNTGIYSPGADQLAISTGGTGRLFVDASGRVGIGTSSPSSLLTVAGKTTLTGTEDNQLEWSLSGQVWRVNTSAAGSWYVFDSTNSKFPINIAKNSTIAVAIADSHLAVSAGGTERARIDSSGRVGIGTSSPSGPLHVANATAGAQNLIVFQNTANGTDLRVASPAAGGQFFVTATAGDSVLRAETNNLAICTADATKNILFGTSAAQRMCILGTGNVGIGTSSPGSILDVKVTDSNTTIGGSASVIRVNNGSGAVGGTSGVEFFHGNDTSSNAARLAGVYGRYASFNASGLGGELVFATNTAGDSTIDERMRITSAGVLQIADAGNITVGTTTGTKIGTATTQKIGFFDKTPVVQPTAVADATDAASVITQLNALLTRMRNLGLIAT